MSQQSYRRRSPAQWQRLIEQQAASGQSQAAFCASQGLSKTTFQHWKRRLKPVTPAALSQSPTEAMFTPLMETTPAPTSEVGSDNAWAVELDLGDGICLRLRRGA